MFPRFATCFRQGSRLTPHFSPLINQRNLSLLQATSTALLHRLAAVSRPSRTINIPVMTQKATLFGMGESEVDLAVQEADDFPNDLKKQVKAMKLLSEEAPKEAIQRYRSGKYAVDDMVTKYFISALVNADKLKSTDLSEILPRNVEPSRFLESETPFVQNFTRSRTNNNNNGNNGNFAGAGNSQQKGTEEEPFYVAMKEASTKSQIWRLIRTIVFLLILLSAMNQAVDQKAMGRGPMGSDNEVKPEDQEHHYTFDDVQGANEAKEELMDVVEFLKNPDRFTRLGGKLPKGVLLMGPPGTGKTLLARAVAGEAGVPFFYCSGSEFDEVFVGVGARRVRELFAAAKKRSPCIIFMDEIDAVGSRRSSKDQQHSQMTLNQLLVELDGFNSSDKVIVVAATNFPESLDPALIRPGRFDTHIKVPLPDVRGRMKILETHAAKVHLANADDLWTIARGTVGFSGAELANLINQAALQASRLQMESIDLAVLEWAKDKILMGAERKNSVITDKDKKVTAYHEGGHALCALYAPGAVPVYKATIVPRGNALGMVTQLPEDDTNSMTRQEMLARMIVCMGGRAAEERIFGYDHVTSGASSDVEQATKLARAMVTKYAMSDKVGPIMFEDDETISNETRALIETEVKKLLEYAMTEAKNILSKHEREHHRLAQALLDHETLTAEEMKLVIKGKKLPSVAQE